MAQYKEHMTRPLALALLCAVAVGCTHNAGEGKPIALARPLERDELVRVIDEKPGVERAWIVGNGAGKPLVVRYETEAWREDSGSAGSFSGRLTGTLRQYAIPPRIVYVAQVKTASPFPPHGAWLIESFMYAQSIADRCARAASRPPDAPPPHNPPMHRILHDRHAAVAD